MNKFNKARKLFASDDLSSSSSVDSGIYISSNDEEASDRWDSDWSTDSEEMIRRLETQVFSCPVPVRKRCITTTSDEPGPSTSQPQEDSTPKFDERYFDEKMFYASSKGPSKCAMELCRTLIPVPDSPMSPPPHQRGPNVETPLMQSVSSSFRASYHIQDSKPYENVSEKRCRSCMVCSLSVDAIKM